MLGGWGALNRCCCYKSDGISLDFLHMEGLWGHNHVLGVCWQSDRSENIWFVTDGSRKENLFLIRERELWIGFYFILSPEIGDAWLMVLYKDLIIFRSYHFTANLQSDYLCLQWRPISKMSLPTQENKYKNRNLCKYFDIETWPVLYLSVVISVTIKFTN